MPPGCVVATFVSAKSRTGLLISTEPSHVHERRDPGTEGHSHQTYKFSPCWNIFFLASDEILLISLSPTPNSFVPLRMGWMCSVDVSGFPVSWPSR